MTTAEKIADIAELGVSVGVAATAMKSFTPKKKKAKKSRWF